MADPAALQPAPTSPPWKVLLIAGSSGTGKTTLARVLASMLGMSTLLVDDVRLALQQLTTAEQHPGLHVFKTDEEAARVPPEQICAGLIQVAQALQPALKIIIAHHVVVAGVGPVIIEGDGILPTLAAPQDYAELNHFWGLRTSTEVRCIILVEQDEQELLENLVRRERGFEQLDAAEQRRLARGSWLYGQWLQQQALQHEIAIITPRPYETLVARVMERITI